MIPYTDDTHPDYILIGPFKFPKGTIFRDTSALKIVGEDGEFEALKGWEVVPPSIAPKSLIFLVENPDDALLRAHSWLKKRGHLALYGIED